MLEHDDFAQFLLMNFQSVVSFSKYSILHLPYDPFTLTALNTANSTTRFEIELLEQLL